MKQFFLLLVFSFLFFTGCKKEKCGEGCYKWGGGYIKYNATIGCDFESALDSLLRVIVFRPTEPYIVVHEPLDVVYPANDRNFYWIAFKDTANRLYLGSPMDVIDTKGDWYKIIWGED